MTRLALECDMCHYYIWDDMGCHEHEKEDGSIFVCDKCNDKIVNRVQSSVYHCCGGIGCDYCLMTEAVSWR